MGGPSGPESRQALTEAVERARAAGSPAAELRAQMWLGLSCLQAAQLELGIEHLRAAMELGVASGTPWAPYAFESRWFLGWSLVVTGQWDEALVVLTAPDDSDPPLPSALLDVLRAQVEAARGADVSARLARMRPLWEREGLIAVHGAELAIEMASRADRVADAVAQYDGVIEVMSRIWNPGFEATVRLAATTLRALAEAAARRPALEWADLAGHAERLVADVRQVLAGLQRPGPETQAWARLAEAEQVRMHWLIGRDPPSAADLVAAWTAAVAAFDAYGHVFQAARTRATLAEILVATGDPDGAQQVAAQAREVAVRLRAEPLLRHLNRVPGPSPRTAAASRTGDELTPREVEVLVLVAQGRSNGEIGKRLYISTKTVSVHVSNILAKLGASGRTEAAALARRRGLIQD